MRWRSGKEAKVNWVTARRAILRKPIDRIGYADT